MNLTFILLCVVSAVNIKLAASFNLLRTKRSTDIPSRCFQPPETGQCQAHFLNYYYNPSSGECETFIYGGCQGNENNFWDIKDCELVCKREGRDDVDVDDEIWESMQALVEDKDDCEYPPETGDCRALFYRYYYNGENCERFVYGGCDGNPNNFMTEEECMERCGPKSENGVSEEENEV